MSKSEHYFQRAKTLIPGGVNSPVRAFKAVGGQAKFFEKAKGPYIYDVDGKKYIDFILSWGPAILGHAPDNVVKQTQKILENGFSFGMSCPLEIKLAEFIYTHVKGIEKVRFVNSGTEATMSAIRLARGFTGKNNIIKFEGCYHGHSDSLLVKAGSGVATFGTSSSAGVPDNFTKHTIPVTFNNLAEVAKAFEQGDIAGVIVEPVPGNMGVVPPMPGFLEGLKTLCQKHNALLIFDEVMCGFRVNETTAADLFHVMPDIFCFGKIIGGGMPVGAFGARNEIMDKLAPEGAVYQAGTLSGNPAAMTAGFETLKTYIHENGFNKINKISTYLREKVEAICAKRKDLKFHIIGSMFTLFFHEGEKIVSMDDVNKCNFDKFGRFFNFMLEKGILLPPSQYEANFLSTVHTKELIDVYVDGLEEFLGTDT